VAPPKDRTISNNNVPSVLGAVLGLFPLQMRKQWMFPVFYDLRPLQEIKMEKSVQKCLQLTGNAKNSGNES
jgi:hypothetical protein